MFKKKLMSVILSGIMVVSLLSTGITVRNTKDVSAAAYSSEQTGTRVVGYLPSYRNYTIDSIDFSALTHCCLSFMKYKNGTLSSDFSTSDVQKIVSKCHANNVKAIIAIGGGGGFDTSTQPFGTAAKRTAFIDQVMNYVNTYNLDGVDIDIEVTDSNLWSNFDAFCSEMSARLKAENKLFTMAVSSWFTDPIKSSTYQYFDFINLMAYDYSFGNGPVAPWNQITDLVAYYNNRGVSNDRMTIGVPFYGYGSGGTAYTYSEIIAMNSANSGYDTYNGIYYNGEDTIKAKAEYSKNFAGIMIWELGQDSFGSKSLLNVIKEVMSTGSTSTVTTKEIPGTFNATEYNTASSEITKYTTSSGTNYVGQLVAGSTLEYKANIARAGKYKLDINAVSGNNNQTRTLSVYSGDTLLAALNVTNMSDWEDFQTISAEVNIPSAGEQTIKIVSSGSANISDITFTKADEITQVPGTVSVSSYNSKSDAITFTTENGITYAGNLNNGTFLDYQIIVPSAGDYSITLKLAAGDAQYNAKNVLVKVNDNTAATVPVQGSTSWTTFIDHAAKIHFAQAGTYKLSIVADSGACNVTDFSIEKNLEPATTEEMTTKVQETSGDISGSPEEVFGVVIESLENNSLEVVWGRNSEKEDAGQRYNVYVDGVKKLSEVECNRYKIENISGGTHTVKVTSVLGGQETAGFIGSITVAGTSQEETTEETETSGEMETTTEAVKTSVVAKVNGCQISSTAEGYRVVYSISDPENEIANAGLVYGLADSTSESEMIVGSTNRNVYSYEATDAGRLSGSFSTGSDVTSYAMTMKFIKTAEFYNSRIYVRAYAKLKNGTYVYSANKEINIVDVADYLYQNELMSNMQGHNYLYNNILKIVNSSYVEKVYDVNNILCK